jgi:hypothetical protein
LIDVVAKLVHDEPGFTYTMHVAGCGERLRGGRLRAWREDDGGLLVLLTVGDAELDDVDGVIADQVRLRFVGERVDVVVYEPSRWGDGWVYLRAVGIRWEPLDPRTLCDRIGPSFVIDDEADTSPGGP